MGMSASQARYLALQAQKSDLEYQAQQINQERTILSQQVTNLYNSLLAMEVPTPPSTTDFTKTVYQGKLGATNYSFDASSIKPGNGIDSYNVTLKQMGYGHSAQKNTGHQVTSETTSLADVNKNTSSNTSFEGYKALTNGDNASMYMVPVTVAEGESTEGLYELNGQTGLYNKTTDATAQSGKTYYKYSETKEENAIAVGVQNKTITQDVQSQVNNMMRFAEGSGSGYNKTYKTVNNNAVYTFENAVLAGMITQEEKNKYQEAIRNSGICDENGNPHEPDDFYIYFDKEGNANFVLKTDLNDKNGNAVSYGYIGNGEVVTSREENDCKLTFDPATGRITEISIPVRDESGKITGYTTIALEAVQETDEVAYKKAFADYEYEQTLYEKAQADINAKTEVIQQQDRNLELQLKELDNRRTQITTEMEALAKVINENIEGSYKTFAG